MRTLTLTLPLTECQYKYSIQRTKWAGVLEDVRVVRAVAALLLLVGLVLGGLVFGKLLRL